MGIPLSHFKGEIVHIQDNLSVDLDSISDTHSYEVLEMTVKCEECIVQMISGDAFNNKDPLVIQVTVPASIRRKKLKKLAKRFIKEKL